MRASERDRLVRAARAARRYAAVPVSGFRVGAALRSADGRVFTGSNVENVSLGLSVCAERVALFKALSEGARRFRAIAVAAAPERPTPPCGACRQLLWEYCGDIPVALASLRRVTGEHRLADLLPLPFDRF